MSGPDHDKQTRALAARPGYEVGFGKRPLSEMPLLTEPNPTETLLLWSEDGGAQPFGRFAPYFERLCLRSPTPAQSSVPRTV